MSIAVEKRALVTGLTATGNLHLGSYLGTLKQWRMFSQTHTCYFFIADLHAITAPQNPHKMRARCLDMAALFISSGVSIKENILFNQSQVPQHAELSWVLSCMSAMGELQRMTQYKEKSAGKKQNETLGLFVYPCLMAADILLYHPVCVPVGEDQKQHLELTRNIAQRFNHHYREIFTIPEPLIPKIGARVMALGEPIKKMSKSDQNVANTIYLLDEPEVIKRKVMRAVTDSQAHIGYETGRPGIRNLVNIYAALTEQSPDSVVDEYAQSGYRAFKVAVADCVIEAFRPIRASYQKIRDDEVFLQDCLRSGAEKAQAVASKTLAQVYDALGFVR